MAFWGGIGSTVEFKARTRNRIEWSVAEIEKDWLKCKWTKGGTRPLFIKLERVIILPGNKRRTESVWTFTEALKEPKAKGKWHT